MNLVQRISFQIGFQQQTSAILTNLIQSTNHVVVTSQQILAMQSAVVIKIALLHPELAGLKTHFALMLIIIELMDFP